MRVDCVGAIVRDGRGRLLLVRRGREPSRGLWSLPGGRVEAGESDAEATRRELVEETGVRVQVGDLVGTVERDGPAGAVYVIRDYACTLEEPEPVTRAGDDADEVGWFDDDEVRRLPTAPGLVEALTGWGVLT